MPTFQDLLDDHLPRSRRRKISSQSPQDIHHKTSTKTDIKLTGPTLEQRTSLNLPARESLTFTIQRLVPALSKSGFHFLNSSPEYSHNWNPTLGDEGRADWRYGSMLLLVEGRKSEAVRGVRNMRGEERLLSGRLLHGVDRPWGLPLRMPFVLRKEGRGSQKGVPIKIVYPMIDITKESGGGCAFEAGEPLLVLTRPGEDPDVALPVINFEGLRGEIYKGLLHYGFDPEPWGILVNAEWMEETINKFDAEAAEWAKFGLIERLLGKNKSTLSSITALSPPSPAEAKSQSDSEPLSDFNDNESNHSGTIASDSDENGLKKRGREEQDTEETTEEDDGDSEEDLHVAKRVAGSFFMASEGLVDHPTGLEIDSEPIIESFFSKPNFRHKKSSRAKRKSR